MTSVVFSDPPSLCALCCAMYGSFTEIWRSLDRAPATALFAGVRVALCVLRALAWLLKAIWWKQKRKGTSFCKLTHICVFFSQIWTENHKKGAKILFLRGDCNFQERIQERVDYIGGEKIKSGFTWAIPTFLSQVWMLCCSFLCLSLTCMYSAISGAW